MARYIFVRLKFTINSSSLSFRHYSPLSNVDLLKFLPSFSSLCRCYPIRIYHFHRHPSTYLVNFLSMFIWQEPIFQVFFGSFIIRLSSYVFIPSPFNFEIVSIISYPICPASIFSFFFVPFLISLLSQFCLGENW